ncbi:MAG TPA: substrate-binding domain-containing protein [Solirubrobacterales bacterium]|nr:substrate-binding domain-containing protein [Solirubrobacterales bacterium]
MALLALVLALGVAACGGSSSSSSSSEPSSSEEEQTGGEEAAETGSEPEAAASGEAETTSAGGTPSWCGEKEITLALADGFGDNNWRKITRAEAEAEANECPSVKEFIYTDGQGNTQKAISDLEGLTAQGVNAAVVFPDAGKAMLPAITNMYKAGVVTVPYRVFPGGEAGVNYNTYVETDFKEAGKLWGEWLLTALKGKGKVLPLGGPAGNTQSEEEYEGMAEVLEGSEIEMIGEQPFSATNWEPAKTQQVITANLAKYPEIDAITTDFGAALASAFPAFKQAGREIPPIATEDSNELSCIQKKEGFPLFTVDSQNWMVRTAIQFAVAEATEGTPPSSNEVPQKAFEDSISGKPNPVQCNEKLSGEAILSSHLSEEELAASLE